MGDAIDIVHNWMRAKPSKTNNLDSRDGSSTFFFIQTCIIAIWSEAAVNS